MIYLLDTHYVLWSLFEPKRITGAVRRIFENDHDHLLVSGINMWEISLKYSLGKLELGGANPGDVFDKLLEAGFEFAELENQLFATYYQLPKKDNHKDPFDRMLIWQAISYGYALITQDRNIEQYRSNGLQTVLG